MMKKNERRHSWVWNNFDVIVAILVILYSIIVLVLHQSGITKPGLFEDSGLPALCTGMLILIFRGITHNEKKGS